MEAENFGLYLISIAALVLGIVALVLTTQKQERGRRGRPGKDALPVTGDTGASFGLSVLESDPVVISGARMLTMGSDPVSILATDQNSSYIILGMIINNYTNPGGTAVEFDADLVIVDRTSAPIHVVVTFPNSESVLNQIRPTATTFGATQNFASPLPNNTFFYLRTEDSSDPTGTGVGASMTVRLLYTKTTL